MMRSSFALAVVATVAALVALLPGANAAYDFTAKPALATLPGCTPAAPGSAAPQVDTSRTNMTKADITMAAWTKPVDGRKMVMYLGKNQVDPDCFAGYVGNTATCRFDFALHGTWQGLRKCGWAAPDTVSRPGYEIRNNTVYIEWQDAFPGGNRQTSRYAYPVSVALTTTVNVQTDVSVLEESGIKNFNLTGLAYETDNGNRYLLLDFSMYSRWPNNLTLDDAGFLNLPFTGGVSIDSYSMPTCVKTSGTGAFTTNDFCYQSGTIRVDLGQTCDVGGTFAFNFDTNCFPGAAATSTCTGKVLTANAMIGTADATGALHLDLCTTLYNTVTQVTGQMVADKPQGYFFGDTITLTATFNSPDLPIYESRLTKLILGRKSVQRSPNVGAQTTVNRNLNTTMVDSSLGPLAVGALSTLATNTNFTYTPGADTVVMTVTPNMLPAVGDTDVSEDSFITTDDFDSVSDFSFYATFRIYFDSASAAGQRRRRLLARDVSVPGNRLRQSTMANTDANAALTVPRDAQPATTAAALPTGGAIPNPVTQTPSSTSEPLLIAAMVIGILALLASCCTIFVLFAVRRRDRKREEEDAFIRQRLVQSFETTKAPVWGTGSSSV